MFCWLLCLSTIATAKFDRVEPAPELQTQAEARFNAGDIAGSWPLFEQAAAQGNTQAMEWLAWMHLEGKGTPPDFGKSRAWSEKAIALGNPRAMYGLGFELAGPKHGANADYKRGLELLLMAHEAGDHRAAGHIGWMYENGNGVPVDLGKAAQWYEQGALRRHAGTQVSYARVLVQGLGTPRDVARARYFINDAIAGNGKNAQTVLALVVAAEAADAAQAQAATAAAAAPARTASQPEPGQAEFDAANKFFFTDKAKAFAGFSQAAALGHTQARINVAAAYAQGDGVAMDSRRARALFLALAEEGDKYSQRTVAKLMMDGGGGPQDYAGARYWLERASNQNDTEAMALLGMMYDPANHRTPDMNLAVFWYQAAHARGNSIAEMWLKQKGLLQPPPAQQAFISRIESQGPDRSSNAAFHYDVAVYCQYGGSRCNALRGEAYRFQEANNRAAESANQQRLWNVYRREAADPNARSECLRKKSESIWRSNSGQQDWYYAGEC
ncbi:SEL1-like repeat protein [Arenimonas sp. MALMAid1274]|uniref:SEL1-like repeat protein n=1 Tax=Arenimonas sp. MALMAid1274 TaxID=3411630 RepID=UPI003BA3A098